MLVLKILEYSLFFYLLAFGLYIFFPALAGRLRTSVTRTSSADRYKICILIPSYKEDAVIFHTAQDALRQTYNSNMYDVCVIADSLQPETLERLRSLPIQVLEVSFEKSTKVKALNTAFASLKGPYDIGVILDADNVMEPDFLRKVAAEFEQGETVVQGCRTAKNMNTSFAVLDAASERVNNHIFRRGFNAIGFSAPIIGSGVAFDYQLMTNALSSNKAVGGFDKMLSVDLIRHRHFIKYLPNALVYDEKVDNAGTFKTQRRRWVSSQFTNLRMYFAQGFRQLFKGNLDYFNLAVMNNLMLPRILLLGLVFACFAAALLLAQWSFVGVLGWTLCMLLYTSAILLSLGNLLFDSRFIKALATAPKIFFIMFGLLFKLKNADSRFIHTPHTHTQVQN
ncbi:glycosyltransferase [Cesiribacter andamanensis]|uniref:N-glycosyltransferase n=1 Tax=Cesiribacter andamanensis AMV16 TaxID=1279009 RepID=M7N2Y5_9BACT|nr:glycosyltransferase [Cesiribacter andamanensis]EMR03043.1 N-glycosyltransferase [Cesiribacter andamanensis AMV16]